MKVPVLPGNGKACARSMAHEYRKSRKLAKEALLDRDRDNFRIHSAHMRSFLEMEIVEGKKIYTILEYLTEEEKQNVYMLNLSEQTELSLWIASNLANLEEQLNEQHRSKTIH